MLPRFKTTLKAGKLLEGHSAGASEKKRGRFERANTGTIFLDEIGELPPQAQVRLLRVLQDKTIERVGGTQTISVNIRVIAATHRNLEEMVEEGHFRLDLTYERILSEAEGEDANGGGDELPSLPPLPTVEQLRAEKEVLGMFLTGGEPASEALAGLALGDGQRDRVEPFGRYHRGD